MADAQKVVDAKCERVRELFDMNRHQQEERLRVRDIMNNRQALVALLGKTIKDPTQRLPIANLMQRADTVLGQKLGRTPDVKVDPPATSDSDLAHRKADKRARTVTWLDDECELEALLPQVGRWVPGYGFTLGVVKQGYARARGADGQRQPIAMVTLRDPAKTFPGQYGVGQNPGDVAVCEVISRQKLIAMFPQHKAKLEKGYQRGPGGAVMLDSMVPGSGPSAMNQSGDGVETFEYLDEQGCWWLVPESSLLLGFVPNVVQDDVQFRLAKRFAFDELVGQYDSAIGVMANMARLALLSTIAVEDAVMSEALALDTPLPTPTGWTTMGEVREGDLLLGADGLPVEVVKATEVQDDRACYRVTFEDGTSVVASDGHLWESRVASTRAVPRVRTTQEMVDDGRRFRVPAPAPWKLPERDLPVDPYVLGAWLGDGHSKNAILTAGTSDIDEVEGFILDAGYTTKRVASGPDRAPQIYISEEGAVKGRNGCGLHGKLRLAGLLGDKHIPADYLRASIDQRLALLQGLMDTDGSVAVNGVCSFSNTNERLTYEVVALLRSLGEVVSVRWYADDRARSGGCFQLNFTPRRVMPVRLARKVDRVKMHRRGPGWVTIKSIERVDTVPVRCVAVASSDHLFLAGEGGHVTHNTNIIGDLKGDEYRRGRNSVNQFTPGTQIEKMNSRVPFEAFRQIDRMERQLRLIAGHSSQSDGESDLSFATGRGLQELAQSAGIEMREYQTTLGRWVRDLDRLRLEFMEGAYPNREFVIGGVHGGTPFAEKMTPSVDIKGDYVTRRVYGAMAGFDDATKIITGLQLVQGKVIDIDTLRENLDGLENHQKIADRIVASDMQEVAIETLKNMAAQGDERAMQAAIGLLPAGTMKTLFEEIFAPKEPAPAEAPMAPPGGTPPDVTTVMSRLTPTGGSGGLQTVGRVA